MKSSKKGVMVVSKELFSRFLELIELKGEIANNEVILKIQKNKINCCVITSNKIVGFRNECNYREL